MDCDSSANDFHYRDLNDSNDSSVPNDSSGSNDWSDSSDSNGGRSDDCCLCAC